MKPLVQRFLEHWRSQGWARPGARATVACSGGLDSLVLLHLLRFQAGELALDVAAAHFDHAMRPGSAADARWLSGLAGAWGVSIQRARAEKIPVSESEARALRYRFLESLVVNGMADCLLTAHHADDQVETVLFRIARGTGVRGLRGIPLEREPRILRPLLPFARAEIEDYARTFRIRPRVDPTNVSPRFARNRVRHRLLPLLEEIHPGAREAVLRLARNAKRATEALDALSADLLKEMIKEDGEYFTVLDRESMASLSEAVAGEVLRRVAEGLGVTLSETGTASGVEFIRSGRSGGHVVVSGPTRLDIEFDQVRVSSSPGERLDARSVGEKGLDIRAPDPGEGEIELGGDRFGIRWGSSRGGSANLDGSLARGDCEWAEFRAQDLSFPLEVRGWRPGDRIRVPAGRTKLKKLFNEERVPRSKRRRLPVLVDSEGLVVWLSGRPHDGDRAESDRWRIEVRKLGNA